MQFPRTALPAALMSAVLLSACSSAEPYLDEPIIPAQETDVDTSVPFTYGADCPPMNTDPADTTVAYINHEKGISLTIPFNAKWGYPGIPVTPYTERGPSGSAPLGSVLFGQPTSGNLQGLGGNCDPLHLYELTFLPARSANDAVRAIEGRGGDVVPNATVRTIDGFTVVQYTDAGLCSYPTIEVIGTDFNYSFTTGCGTDVEGEWKYLEDIVKTVKLTK